MTKLKRAIDRILPLGRTKLSFDVVPHVGILPIKLATSRQEIGEMMRELGHHKSNTLGQIDRYIDGSVGVEFDAEDRASFVELHPHRDLVVTYRGEDVFDQPAEEVFRLIAKSGAEDDRDFDPSEHLFRKQIVTLWHADPQYDLGGERFPVWGSIGVGDQGYLRFVDQLNAPP